MMSASGWAQQTWTGGGADNSWGTAGNWSGGVPADYTHITFSGPLRTSPVLDKERIINSLTFSSGAAAFTLGGSPILRIGSGGITNNSSHTQTITHPVAVQGSQTWNVGSGGLVVSGNVSSPWHVTLTKTGSGTLTLSGNNSGFVGPVVISAGTVVAAADNAFGNATYSNTVASGATLALTGGVILTEGDLYIAGGGVNGGGALRNISGNNTLYADLKLSASATVTSDAGNLVLGNSVIASGHTLTLDGAGNISVPSHVSNVGNLVIAGSGDRSFSGSQINVNAGGSIILNGDGHTVFDTRITASNGYFVQTSGTTTFAGDENNFFHSVNISGGHLILNNSVGYAMQIDSKSGTVTIENATVEFGGDNQVADWTDVTLGDNAVLKFNDTAQHIDSLTITGDSILDFGEGGSTFDISSLTLHGDSVLTIVNWSDDLDTFFANVNPGSSTLAKIIFDGIGEAAWDSSSGTGVLIPTLPVPEPAATGLLLLGGLATFPFLRRPRRPAVSPGDSR
jgi:autotransporter-associated beta strand repeat